MVVCCNVQQSRFCRSYVLTRSFSIAISTVLLSAYYRAGLPILLAIFLHVDRIPYVSSMFPVCLLCADVASVRAMHQFVCCVSIHARILAASYSESIGREHYRLLGL